MGGGDGVPRKSGRTLSESAGLERAREYCIRPLTALSRCIVGLSVLSAPFACVKKLRNVPTFQAADPDPAANQITSCKCTQIHCHNEIAFVTQPGENTWIYQKRPHTSVTRRQTGAV